LSIYFVTDNWNAAILSAAAAAAVPSRQHVSYDVHMDVKSEDYQGH